MIKVNIFYHHIQTIHYLSRNTDSNYAIKTTSGFETYYERKLPFHSAPFVSERAFYIYRYSGQAPSEEYLQKTGVWLKFSLNKLKVTFNRFIYKIL